MKKLCLTLNGVTLRSFLRIWSNLLKNSFMENFIFCAVDILNVRIFYHWLVGNNETGLKLFTSYLLSLLCICTTLVFFQWHWKTPVSRHNGKIICEGLQIGLPLNLNILLWQWAITPFFNFWQCICSTNTFSKTFRNVSWL